MLVTWLAMGVLALGLQEREIEKSDLPSIADLNFPELTGDFDGDGADDRARARQGDQGVEIALELSSRDDAVIETLGAATLGSVDWRVVGEGEAQVMCGAVAGCGGDGGAADAILVTLDGSDSFILRWDGDALETVFVDA